MISKNTILLSGLWKFKLDPDNIGIEDGWYSGTLPDTIELPGTTDEQHKGPENTERAINCLTRRHPYVGPAFYQNVIEIPEAWRGKHIIFSIERTKHSMVWSDKNFLGKEESLTTSHIYDLTEYMTPGRHRLTVRIDNSNLPPVGDSHQVSDHTQTNWNGLLGKLELQVKDSCYITDLQAFPDVANKKLKLCLNFNTPCNGDLKVIATDADSENTIISDFENITADGKGDAEVILDLGDNMQYWDEFNPELYHITVSFTNETSSDSIKLKVGMRDFGAENGQFQVNGHTTFLRGKHDACVFPLTGYAPMDSGEWKRIMSIAKSYGINHYRFHSYCPPRAAFEAADELGIYMQPELPLWESIGASNVDPMGDVEFRGSGDETVMEKRIRYLVKEGLRILKEFGNHPSFCMFALGNELGGDPEVMASLVRRFKHEDPRHLYAHGSNNFIFEPKKGTEDDYWITMMTGGNYRRGNFDPNCKGLEVRGSYCAHNHGHVNNDYPSTTKDFSNALKHVDVPVIGHEVGQYQVFPNFDEIKKYTGVLHPGNLEIIRDKFKKAGMLSLADDFFRASGALSVLCYREDIETALRTSGFGGFQLLDLQDFPGQGTALVGILDAFMDSKGLIQPEEWREFCNDVVLLAKMEKYTWTSSETFSAELCMANYSRQDFKGKSITWCVITDDDRNLASGKTLPLSTSETGFIECGTISFDFTGVKSPEKLELVISIEDTNFRNRYPVWVYEENADLKSCEKSVTIARELDQQTLDNIIEGADILLLPNNSSVKNRISGSFQSDFWCYPMFKKYDPPGTLGIFCDPEHPAMSRFPTEFHSNWQWWCLLKNGCAMVMDSLPRDIKPIVRVIDNFERNHHLAVAFECRVAKGRLLVCSCNLLEQQNLPEARQLLSSLLGYMNSDQFVPSGSVSTKDLLSMFK